MLSPETTSTAVRKQGEKLPDKPVKIFYYLDIHTSYLADFRHSKEKMYQLFKLTALTGNRRMNEH